MRTIIRPKYSKDNAPDKKGDFPQQFERKWVEYRGDVIKLTEHFGWKGNCKTRGVMVSASVCVWEKKLNLRDKHHEILESKKDIKNILELGVKRLV